MSDFIKLLKKRAAAALLADAETVVLPVDELAIVISNLENNVAQIAMLNKQVDELQQSVGGAMLFGFDGALGCLQNARANIIKNSTPMPISPTTEGTTDGNQENSNQTGTDSGANDGSTERPTNQPTDETTNPASGIESATPPTNGRSKGSRRATKVSEKSSR